MILRPHVPAWADRLHQEQAARFCYEFRALNAMPQPPRADVILFPIPESEMVVMSGVEHYNL